MLRLTEEALKKAMPRAPKAVLSAFVSKQAVLDKAGITKTPERLAYFFCNIAHECGEFTIPNLTENINYSAARMAQVWPNRFSSASAVKAKYGTAAGWQKKAFNDIYGNRMGNRPGTSDGSTYIGRAGPQWTGRDGYAELKKRTGIPAVSDPESITAFEIQPEVCTAFFEWKKLNACADKGDFIGAVKRWNGGTNGLADRQQYYKKMLPIFQKLEEVEEEITPAEKPLPQPAPKQTPEISDGEEVTETKPLSKSKTFWASVTAMITTVGGYIAQAGEFLTDWRTLAVLVVVGLLMYIIWERNGKPDIRGWFR